MKKKLRIFIVEDALFLREMLCRVLHTAGMEVVGLADSGGEETLLKIEILKPDLALVDLALPKQNGLALINKIYLKFPEMKVIVCSGLLKNREIILKSEMAGVLHFINKPFGSDEIVDKIYSVVKGRKSTAMAA